MKEKKYLMVDGRVLDKIEKISIKKLDDTKILIDTDDKLSEMILL